MPSERDASTDLGSRATLRDPVLDQRLREEGYAVIDLLDESAVTELLALCRAVHPPRTGWESDFYDPDPALKRRVHEAIGAAAADGIAREFVDHRSLLHNFVINWPGDDGGLVLHHHSSLVDERRFRSVIVWCALNPATEENGTLHVVPRSHLVQVGPRPERAANWFDRFHDRLLKDHLVSVPLAPGQALVFDNHLLHCSFANRTDEPRITAAAVVIPSAAEPLYYEVLEPDRVRVHRLDAEFFFAHQAGEFTWADPDDLEVVEELPWQPVVVSSEEIDVRFPPGTCSHVA